MQEHSIQIAKRAAGYAAADFVHDGMLIGLGTGSTAFYFIEKLIQRCREGLKIKALPTSKKSEEQAIAGGIPILDANTLTFLDLTIDGADEIDRQKRMIKGGGGALLREKIIASMSREMIVIVDEHKIVERLGKVPLPVEIVPFAYKATLAKFQQLGYSGSMRKTEDDKLYLTDSGHYIFDIQFPEFIVNPEKEQELIRSIPGVVETGFFFGLAGTVLVGFADGHVEIWKERGALRDLG
jgi:ribose 5-phosphate isomerase A